MEDITKQILEAADMGADNSYEVLLETGLPRKAVIAWFANKENSERFNLRRGTALWNAKKKVMTNEKTHDAQWLLTHHKETKSDWSDRTELTGKNGEDLLPKPIIDVT